MRTRHVKCRWLDWVSSIAMMIYARVLRWPSRSYMSCLYIPPTASDWPNAPIQKANLPPTYRTVDTTEPSERLSTNRRLERCMFRLTVSEAMHCHSSSCCRWNRWALFSFSLFTQSWFFFSCFRYLIFCSLFEGMWTNGTWWAKSRQQWWSFEATVLFMQAHIRHCFEFVDDETAASTINIHISCACISYLKLVVYHKNN